MTKQVAIIGGTVSANALMAAIAATGCQVDVFGSKYTLKNRRKTIKRNRKGMVPRRIKKQWYTVDSPEVKRMSQ